MGFLRRVAVFGERFGEKGCEFVKCEDDSSGISSQPC